jgi:hypothetical protein
MKFLTCLRIPAWLLLVFFSGLLIYNSLPYFHAPRTHAFVWEKGLLADRPLWLCMLVIHAAAGVVCLLSSLLQFYRPLLRRVPALHRWLGRIHVCAILGFLTPTGFYLAFSAHGGWLGTTGFLILGVTTALTTWKGWMAMRRNLIQQHVAWMVRSFAMVASALTFRVEYLVLQQTGIAADTAFSIALYLSIIGNAVIAEWLLWRIRLGKTKPHQPTNHETTPVISLPAAIGRRHLHPARFVARSIGQTNPNRGTIGA